MAHVTYDGTPDVQPQSAPPDDYQRLDVNAGAFGEKTAEGAQKIGDAALGVQKFYGQVAADNGTNNTLDQVTKTLYGDPDKKVLGPDGTLVPDTGYFGLRGADAMSARKDVGEHIDEVIRENRSNLSTPESQYQYDVDTRRYRAQWQREMGAHADDQQRIWATDTNNTSAQLALNGLARNPAAEPTQEQIDAVRNPIVKNAQLQFGNTPQVTQGAVLKADQAIAEMRVKSLLETNAPLAEKVFNDNRGILASLPDYDMLSERVKNRSIDAQIGPASQALLSQYTPGSGTATGSRAQINIANNNPGNIKVPGSTTQFQRFPTMQAGVDAVGTQIERDINVHGLTTISALISDPTWGYAPSGVDKNNSAAYIADVAQRTKIDPNTPLTPKQIPAVRDAMIAHEQGGRTVQQLLARGGGAVASAPPQQTAQSQADYYRENYTNIMQNAQAQAERDRPGDAVYADKLVARTAQTINHYLTQQELVSKANADTVYHALKGGMTNGHLPTTMAELRAVSPEVSKALDDYEQDNPTGYNHVETRLLTANSRGKAAGYGTEFYKMLRQTLAPSDDPTYVHDASKFLPFVQPGETGPLSNTGFSELQGVLNMRGTPQGEAFATSFRNFLDSAHGQISGSDQRTGVIDHKGDQMFNKFLPDALSKVQAGLKAGKTPAQLFNPQSQDYVGDSIYNYTRPVSQRVKDMTEDKMSAAMYGPKPLSQQQISLVDHAVKSKALSPEKGEALKSIMQAVASHRMTRQQAISQAVSQGLIAPPAPSVPAPSGMQ